MFQASGVGKKPVIMEPGKRSDDGGSRLPGEGVYLEDDDADEFRNSKVCQSWVTNREVEIVNDDTGGLTPTVKTDPNEIEDDRVNTFLSEVIPRGKKGAKKARRILEDEELNSLEAFEGVTVEDLIDYEMPKGIAETIIERVEAIGA